ncbi:MAG TPA: penicillin acylase family protein [Hydrogenophaga sp.]|uniref:penicillin acylase family protein n=1 Tax=Hydrogenophaga sp. TaxID=1904254 RepID=UPI002D152B5E|nr:penicillin acylase family protein [Hydrogenophaga sp.]HMN94558.1 penicillin acylase family protein [Hydrogenophaga sp.]HMP10111.1 penicillin acylase family protein [Hydrogenophaga sp.]
MKRTLKWLLTGLVALALVLALAAYWTLRSSGRAQVDGELRLEGLEAPVRVLRDASGVPYIFAENVPDLFRAQGFVTAQHRLMQMELFRATWRGELAASFGEAALPSDVRMRVLGIQRNGERHAQRIGAATRAHLQPYVDGINAFVRDHAHDHPIELKIAGLRPQPWSVTDLVTLVHFVNHSHATNLKAEVVAQRLIDRLGEDRAVDLLPLTRNPEWAPGSSGIEPDAPVVSTRLDLDWSDLLVVPETLSHQGLGSNNWAVGPSRSASGKAMLANDPHLDNRILPGMWHPVGLFAPGVQAVGAALPGVPGILVGRTRHVAFGVTNAYGDVQDLYVETLDPADPGRYLDGGVSRPFELVREVIRVKDKAAPGGVREHPLTVRYTRRGPVVSDHPGLGPKGDKLLVLRSTSAELHAPQLGIEGLLTASDAASFDAEVQKIDLMMFNFVFADDAGAIGHRATGAVPIRAGADGSVPRVPPSDGTDDWTGFIPKDRMPGMVDPPRAWVGTANHDTRPADFPWYYTNYVAPDYRYRRMSEVLSDASQMTVDDHWRLMRDDRNLQSDGLRPLIVEALKNDPAHGDLAAVLEDWDGVDRAEDAAPLVYQALYREIALGTFTDELGEELAADMLATWYFWQQRFDALLETPDATWFDDVRTTDRQETLTDVIRSAAPRARALIEAQQGTDPSKWQWGRSHRLSFVSPLRRKGLGQEWVGGFSVEKSGGGETLNRGVYDFMAPFDVKFFTSMQLVVDFGDPDKIEAVLAGGVSERHFQPHQNDQARLWAQGQRSSWWFNPQRAEAMAVSRAMLTP